MEFRTPIRIHPSPDKIRLGSPLLSIGSCFSTCIGERLSNNKFDILVNPFGTVFNPHAIFKLLQYALSDNRPAGFTYIENQGIWRNLDFHTDFSALDRSSLQKKIDTTLTLVKQWLPRLSYLLLTPGTAWVYETRQENFLVSNCHKLPATTFYPKRLLEVAEIVESFGQLKEGLQTINPGLKYIFTVSPVRHIKDTLELNALSKATLLMAIRKLKEQYDVVGYFPSYEIMMDDLRDYRFFKADMIHPNTVAEDYIWDCFSSRYFDEGTQGFLRKWQKVRQAIAHKPFHADSLAYKSFVKNTIGQLESLKGFADVSEELKLLKERLK